MKLLVVNYDSWVSHDGFDQDDSYTIGASKNPVMHFKTNPSDGGVEFDAEMSHLGDYLFQGPKMPRTNRSVGQQGWGVEVNPRLPCAPQLSIGVSPSISEEFCHYLPINGVLKSSLGIEAVERVISIYERESKKAFSSSNDPMTTAAKSEATSLKPLA